MYYVGAYIININWLIAVLFIFSYRILFSNPPAPSRRNTEPPFFLERVCKLNGLFLSTNTHKRKINVRLNKPNKNVSVSDWECDQISQYVF